MQKIKLVITLGADKNKCDGCAYYESERCVDSEFNYIGTRRGCRLFQQSKDSDIRLPACMACEENAAKKSGYVTPQEREVIARQFYKEDSGKSEMAFMDFLFGAGLLYAENCKEFVKALIGGKVRCQ